MSNNTLKKKNIATLPRKLQQVNYVKGQRFSKMERVKGIEPS